MTGTLRADMGDNQLAVATAAGFMGGQGSKAGDIGYGEEVSPTIKGEAGGNSIPCVMAVENYAQDSRVKMDESGTVQTLTSRMGTGGNNVPLVMNERQLAMTIYSETANALMGSDYKGVQCVFEPTAFTQNQREEVRDLKGVAGAIAADPGIHQQTYVLQGSMIRREEKTGLRAAA